jgi:exopolyphosphatase/guanosine-5'-triphosphate,3'-diphosphate pyrophosphatase
MSLTLFRRREVAAPDAGRVGIIDIGSNSIRLVVFDGPARIPAVLFNEKVMAGLGRDLGKTGALNPESVERAVTALMRFRQLSQAMNVTQLRTVATAAVREASNGKAFLERISALGLEPELLSGTDEATMAGYGVIAGIPWADGIVGDLGGGSLELARVKNGKILDCVSFPLGVLLIEALRAKGHGTLDRKVGQLLEKAGWQGAGAGLPFYIVGGSWRALARLDMALVDYPLPIVHHYRMPIEQPMRLVRVLAQIDKKRLRNIEGLSTSRIPTLPDAAALLAVLVKQLNSSGMVVSAYGLREGLLYQSLPDHIRAIDPLIDAARIEGALQGRFPEHGDLLNEWIAPLFADDSPDDRRLRHAACLLGDIGWRAHPEFRAERGLDVALHGNWVAVDARGRGMLGEALYTSFGGTRPLTLIDRLIGSEDRLRAQRWGFAIRLGQRLSGGAAEALNQSGVADTGDAIRLTLTGAAAALNGESVERRMKSLATSFAKQAEIVALD